MIRLIERRRTNPSVRLLQGLSVLVLGQLGCAAERGPGRVIATVQWDTVWQASPEFMESALPTPALMTYSRGTLFVFDRAMVHLAALDANTGLLLWTVGRLGQGPEEFAGISGIFTDRLGGVGLVDIRNRRISRVSRLGQFTGLVPIAGIGQQPNQVCAIGGNRFMAADVYRSELLMFDSTGTIVGKQGPIWPDLVETASVDSRTVLLWNDEGAHRCLVALYSGRGFALVVEGKPPLIGRYIEVFEPFGVGDREHEGEMNFSAINDAEFVADTILVLFSGRTADRGHVIDRYNALSGTYLDSYLLPFRTVELAAGGGMVFGIDSAGTSILAVRVRR